MAEAKMFFEHWDVDRRLSELGLKEFTLIRAGQAGLSALTSCTENHPPGSPGYFAWAETVRALRDLLMPAWDRKNENNLSLVTNEDKTVEILVATGDANTGLKDRHPRTKAAKGPKTKGRVDANRRYMDYLWPEMAEIGTRVGPATWIYLIRCDMKAHEFRSELSRPIDMSDDGYIDDWAERIILTPTSFDGIRNIVPYDNDSPLTPELRIEIKARA